VLERFTSEVQKKKNEIQTRLLRKTYKPKVIKRGCVWYVEAKRIPYDVVSGLEHDYRQISDKYGDSQYGCYHKIPLYIGGDNSESNLVRMTKKEHILLLRDIINPQIEKMHDFYLNNDGKRQNSAYTIVLPAMNGKGYSLDSFDFSNFLAVFPKETGITLSPDLKNYTLPFKLMDLEKDKDKVNGY